MPKKLSEEEVDNRLLVKNIKRLSPYINMRSRHVFQCLIEGCERIWTTDAHSILIQGKGCAKCYGNVQLTNQEIDKRLSDSSIKRLDDYINSLTHIRWQCLNINCNHIWLAKPYHIYSSGSGCPKCTITKPMLLESVIDERLINRSIKRIDNYLGITIPISFLCLNENCGFIWKTDPNNILNNETGCPACCSGKNENLVWEILTKTSLIVKRQVSIKEIILNENRRIILDFYLPEIKTIIEYNGKQHYQPIRFGGISRERANDRLIKQQERDSYLQNLCENEKISLIWIDGREYYNSKLKNYLSSTIIPMLI
jgi:hypothetical protein